MAKYLDFNAGSPIRKEAWQAYQEGCRFIANPSSPHELAKNGWDALERCRGELADWFGVSPDWVTFTSGGTEANALMLLGFPWCEGDVVLSSSLEHPAVFKNLEYLDSQGKIELKRLPIDAHGCVLVEAVEAEMKKRPIRMISVMAAQNETGVIQPISEIAKLCAEHAVIFHSDTVQLCGKYDFRALLDGVDAWTMASHKFGAVGGVGVLFSRPGLGLEPLLAGGGQENGLRSSTQNVPGIMSLVRAFRVANGNLGQWNEIASQRDQMEEALREKLEGIEIIGSEVDRLANTSMFRAKGCPGDGLMMFLDVEGYEISTGSACSSGSISPSPALLAMGYSEADAREFVRISFGSEFVSLPGLIQKIVAGVTSARA